jgi:hypothetical protein
MDETKAIRHTASSFIETAVHAVHTTGNFERDGNFSG